MFTVAGHSRHDETITKLSLSSEMEWRWHGDHAEAEARNPRIDKVIASQPPCLPGLKDIGQFAHATLARFEPIENIQPRLTWKRMAQFSCSGSVSPTVET
jgi:hypothetical protein